VVLRGQLTRLALYRLLRLDNSCSLSQNLQDFRPLKPPPFDGTRTMVVSAFQFLLYALLTTSDCTYAVGLPTVDASTLPATFQLFDNSSSIFPSPPEACGAALSSVIKCNQTLLYLQSRSTISSPISLHNLRQPDFTGLCATGCFTSLQAIAGSVENACSNKWTYDLSNGRQIVSYVPSMPFQWLEYTFNQTCLTDTSTMAFCALTESASTGDVEVALPDLPTAQLCVSCMLDTLHNQMASPFGYDSRFEDDWLTIQQKCAVNLTVAVPSALTTTLHATSTSSGPPGPTLVPASNSSCLYSKYTVEADDTVDSIAETQGLSYYQLILINGLMFDGSVLPPIGGTICLSGPCRTYVVKENDTCVNVAKANGITWTQIKSW
jgi:LysM repeat protein